MAEMGGLEAVGQARGLGEAADRRALALDRDRADRRVRADRNRVRDHGPCRGVLPIRAGRCSAGLAPLCPRVRTPPEPPGPAGPPVAVGPPCAGVSASTATEGAPTGGDVSAEPAGRGGRGRRHRVRPLPLALPAIVSIPLARLAAGAGRAGPPAAGRAAARCPA